MRIDTNGGLIVLIDDGEVLIRAEGPVQGDITPWLAAEARINDLEGALAAEIEARKLAERSAGLANEAADEYHEAWRNERERAEGAEGILIQFQKCWPSHYGCEGCRQDAREHFERWPQ